MIGPPDLWDPSQGAKWQCVNPSCIVLWWAWAEECPKMADLDTHACLSSAQSKHRKQKTAYWKPGLTHDCWDQIEKRRATPSSTAYSFTPCAGGSGKQCGQIQSSELHHQVLTPRTGGCSDASEGGSCGEAQGNPKLWGRCHYPAVLSKPSLPVGF